MLKLFFLFLVFFGLSFISCKKEPVVGTASTSAQPPPPPLPPVNPLTMSLNLHAGSNIYTVLPENSCTLKGSAQYPESIETILWNKISGPDFFAIEHPNSFETKVQNLVKGVYVFELTATGKAGLTGKDNVSVFVLEEGSGENELIFKDLKWGCPMGCHLRIENFHSFIPIGIAFKAYLKRDDATQWVEIINMTQGSGKYVWTIYNNGLEIQEDQTEYPNDTPDVKIIF